MNTIPSGLTPRARALVTARLRTGLGDDPVTTGQQPTQAARPRAHLLGALVTVCGLAGPLPEAVAGGLPPSTPVAEEVAGVGMGVSTASASEVASPSLAGKWRVGSFGLDGSFSFAKATSRGGKGVSFKFLDRPDTAYMLTDHPAYKRRLVRDLNGKTLVARLGVKVSPGTEFEYFGEPDGSGRAANVRLYFETDRSLRPITCPCEDKGPGSFWYSDPVSVDLQVLHAGEVTLSVKLDPAQWSDAQEHPGDIDDTHRLFFAQAVADVDHVGLSFGGGRHFHNGVGIKPGTGTGQFLLRSFEVVDQ